MAQLSPHPPLRAWSLIVPNDPSWPSLLGVVPPVLGPGQVEAVELPRQPVHWFQVLALILPVPAA